MTGGGLLIFAFSGPAAISTLAAAALLILPKDEYSG